MSDDDEKKRPSGALRKLTVPWVCDACRAKDFGLEISDEYRTWLRLPGGWWYYPVDHGDGDGDGGRTIMMHAFCSEKCINQALEDAAKNGAVAAGNAPLRTNLGELLKKRRIVP